ncbi:hypothetical protein [Mesorhizobium sp. B2-3-12]|uniref:hypothetical protein n=1 Tax=Mesorhizobium sp. B2-3-12 TaxID=2589952 RepID=UPI00112BB716|nr:hypothetical protein [Mesorhizobium sp. B2-3-12]TPL87111.1 hypothetical protein FJ948_21675 [Mesorhizobium sp. B2-3-12]
MAQPDEGRRRRLAMMFGSCCAGGNRAISVPPLIVLPDISPRKVTGRKGRVVGFAKQKGGASFLTPP